MKLLRFFIVFSIIASSCNVINKDEATPSFIKIDNLVLNPGIHGAAQNNITDVWISANGKFVGVFEIPAIIPILTNGEMEINIAAGIQNNGFASDRIIYPLTNRFITTINVLPEETITLEPVFTYFDDVSNEAFNEVFESSGGGVSFIENAGSISVIDDPTMDSSPLQDIGVGRLSPLFDENNVEITSYYSIPTTTIGPTMLEFNYKANQNFVVGLKSNTPGDPTDKTILIGLNTSFNDSGELEWKKIYVNLEAHMELFNAQNRYSYNLYFASETEINDPIIYLDNVKIFTLEQ